MTATRKDFKNWALAVSMVSDEVAREILIQYYCALGRAQNPRFSQAKFRNKILKLRTHDTVETRTEGSDPRPDRGVRAIDPVERAAEGEAKSVEPSHDKPGEIGEAGMEPGSHDQAKDGPGESEGQPRIIFRIRSKAPDDFLF